MKRIQVMVRATDKLCMIAEKDFDEALHIRVSEEDDEEEDDEEEDDDPEERDGQLTAAAISKAVGTAVGRALSAAGVGKKDKNGKRMVPGADDEPEEVERFSERTRMYGTALRCVPGFEARYARLPEDERCIRTPEGDVETWRWFNAVRAHQSGDESGMAVLKELADHDKKRRAELDGKDPFIRQLGTDTTAIGGALVPTPLANLIILKRDKKERLLPRAMRYTSDAETLTIPSEDTVGAVAGKLENVAIGETDSTFADLVLSKQKVGRIVRTANELLESISSAFSLSTILANQAARKIAVFMDDQGAQTGEGTRPNHKLAIAQATIATVATVTGALTRAKIVTLILALGTEWRDGVLLHLMGNANITAFISQLEDTTGRPLYSPQDAPTIPFSDVGAAVNVVEGLPYVELPFTADTLFVGALGEGFAVLEGGGIRVAVTQEGNGTFEKDQTAWRFTERRDSGVQNLDAFKKSIGAMTAPV